MGFRKLEVTADVWAEEMGIDGVLVMPSEGDKPKRTRKKAQPEEGTLMQPTGEDVEGLGESLLDLADRADEAAAVDVGPGVKVLTTKQPRFPNLDTAIASLVTHLEEGERLLLVIARDVQAIRDQELYKEVDGVENMAQFFPILLTRTAQVGWGSVRTLKAYMSFADIYLDTLQLPEDSAMGAVSHLQTLQVLGDWDRKEKELRLSTDKEGKLGSVRFEAVVKVITSMVNAPDDVIDAEFDGADERRDQTVSYLRNIGIDQRDIDAWTELLGAAPMIPAAGWTVAETKQAVKHIQGKKEVERAKQVWYVEKQDDKQVWVSALAWEVADVEKRRVPMNGDEPILRSLFEKMSKGDKVVDLSEGEKGDAFHDKDFDDDE